MGLPKSVWDLELVYIHVAVLISLGLTFYFFIFTAGMTSIFYILALIILVCLFYVLFVNRNRWIRCNIDSDMLIINGQAIRFFRSRTIKRNAISEVYLLDSGRWRWMRGKEEHFPLAFFLKNGDVIRIDQPRGRIEDLIRKQWGIDLETISSVHLTRMKIERSN